MEQELVQVLELAQLVYLAELYCLQLVEWLLHQNSLDLVEQQLVLLVKSDYLKKLLESLCCQQQAMELFYLSRQ